MMNSKTLLALFAGAISVTEAVTIKAFRTNQCAGGPYEICNNIGANVCCDVIVNGNPPHAATSGEFLGLPGGSSFSGYQATPSTPCGQSTGLHSGATNACITLSSSQGEYAGFAWFSSAAKVRRAAEHECKGKQEVDTIVFGNGTAHSLEGMTRAEKAALWEVAVKEWEAEKNVLVD